MKNSTNTRLSDELLASFLDGNASEAEVREILGALASAPVLRETLKVAAAIDSRQSDILPMERQAAESDENLCALLCEAHILLKRGIKTDTQELLDEARDNGWITPAGTPLHAIGQLLAGKGVPVTRRYDATTDDIVDALSRDNDIIVAVNSSMLFAQPGTDDAANHAVVVTGIDPTAGTVTLYDPGQLAPVQMPAAVFSAAWSVSCNYMVCALHSVEEYRPRPVRLDGIVLNSSIADLQDAIAENAHEVWAEARMREGWTYGTVRDDQHRKHPDLVPYSSLPESEKEYDRIMALNTIRLLMKLGYRINRD